MAKGYPQPYHIPRHEHRCSVGNVELIAEIISELEGEHREKAAYAFAYVLPMTNGNFDSQRFLQACKVSAFTGGHNQ